MEDDDDASSATGSEVRLRIDPAGLTRAQQNLSTPRALSALLTYFISQHHAVRQPSKTLAETHKYACSMQSISSCLPRATTTKCSRITPLPLASLFGSSQPGLPAVVVDRGGCQSGMSAAALPLCA